MPDISVTIPNCHPVTVKPLRDGSHRSECTRSVVFIYQSKRRTIYELPDWLDSDGDSFVVDRAEIDEYSREEFDDFFRAVKAVSDEHGDIEFSDAAAESWLCNAVVPGSSHDRTYGIEYWHDERIYMTREEAEEFGRNNVHNNPEWRVYGMPSYGLLANLVDAVRESGRDAK